MALMTFPHFRTPLLRTALLGVFAAGLLAAAPARAIEINAREYILVDFQTGAVLEERNADERMPPSSMSKLMTAYMVFDALKSGRLSLDDQLAVSENAWRQGGAASGGSTMFLEPRGQATVEDLLRGMIIQSGNDACIVLAENMSGSETSFAEAMNEKAEEIGLTGSHFTNATGLPDPEHYMTARDLTVLARRIIQEFPEFYSLYGETSFTYNGITQGNRNPLLYRVGSGADGLKTGHTEAAGYGLTASAVRNNRRLILVANGMSSIKAREEETAKLLDWGFREFVNRNLFRAGDVVTDAEIWLGDVATVPLVIEQELTITLPRPAAQTLEVKAVYQGPLPAPIAKGTPVATLVISGRDMKPLEIPLVAGTEVGRLSFIGRLKAAAQYIFFGPPQAPAAPATPPAPATTSAS